MPAFKGKASIANFVSMNDKTVYYGVYECLILTSLADQHGTFRMSKDIS